MTDLEETVDLKYPYFMDIIDEIDLSPEGYTEKKRASNCHGLRRSPLLSGTGYSARTKPSGNTTPALFSHILVDEYQDTNRIQAEIVDFMGLINRNVTVVGDDAQSIYSFRGANFQNILEFPKRYPEARVFRLETNYRSTPEILDLANHSISHNTRQFEKNLKAVKTSGVVPVVTSLRDVIQQAEFVAQRILELRDEGVPLSEIAVLYRAHYHSMELQMELTRRDIPFEIQERPPLLRTGPHQGRGRLLAGHGQPHRRDILEEDAQDVPADRQEDRGPYLRVYQDLQDPVALFITKEIGQTVQEPDPAENIETWSKLFGELEGLQKYEAPSDMISAVLKHGYMEYLKFTYPNHENRLEDINQLINFSTEYDSLVNFLSELSLMSGISGEEVVEGGQEDEKVVLSTIHQAKGLEWKAVFVIWCAEGRFPNPKAVEEGETEEERRLFYVASTRAMDELYLCYPLHGLRQSGRLTSSSGLHGSSPS